MHQDALGQWQEALKRALNAYLDGDFLRVRSRWLFPLNWELSPSAVQNALADIAYASHALRLNSGDSTVSAFLDHLDLALRRFNTSPEETFLAVLTDAYRLLDHLIRTTQPEYRLETIQTGPEFDAQQYLMADSGYLAPVVRLVEFIRHQMSPYLTMSLIHGSVADLNFCKGYSDLDTLLVINRETVFDPVRLGEFARICYRSLAELYQFDPLQHHGHMVMTAVDLNNYQENWLPLSVFPQSKSINLPSGDVAVGVRDSQWEARRAFEYDADYFRLLKTRHWMPRDAYDLKYYLSILMLLPTRYLEAKGVFCTKGDSFDLAKQRLPDAAWQVMDYASQLRSDWPYARSGVVNIVGQVPGLLNVQMTRYLQRTALARPYRAMLDSFSPRHVELAADLAEQMFNDLCADEPVLTPICAGRTKSGAFGDAPALSVVHQTMTRTRDEYQQARERYVNQVKNVRGVVAVYEYGSIGAPGLSDLDFVVCVSDEADGIDARLLSIDCLPFWDQSLVMHNPLILPQSQLEYIQEFLIGADLRELWRGSSSPLALKALDPQIAPYVQAARSVEKLFSYQVWFADVLTNQVLDARWAIAILRSLIYSVSLVKSVTGDAPGDSAAYIQAADELRACWLADPSLYRKYAALRNLVGWGQGLTQDLVEALDGFLTRAGWLRTDNIVQDRVPVFTIPQSRTCVAFQASTEQSMYPMPTKAPKECSQLVTLPSSFLRALSLYAPCAPHISRTLTIRLRQSEIQPEMAPDTEFERYLCERAHRLQVQARFLVRHRLWYGGGLPEQLLYLSQNGN